MIQLIRDNWLAETSRTIIERNLSLFAANRSRIFNYLIMDQKINDLEIDSLITMHQNKNDLSDQLALIDLYFENEDYTNCDLILNELKSSNHTQDIIDGIYALEDLISVLRSAKDSARTLMELSRYEHDQLINIAQLDVLIASSKAQNILCFVFDECIDKSPTIDTIIPQKRARIYDLNDQNKIGFVKVTPIPADEFINIEWDFPENSDRTISVFNAEGKLVFTFDLFDKSGGRAVNISLFTSGIYLYQVHDSNEYIESGNLIISH